jgi:hypothetical protein
MTEQDRISASKAQAEAIAATRRDADEAHRERIHAEIAVDLRSVQNEDFPGVVDAIAAGRIRHLTINY